MKLDFSAMRNQSTKEFLITHGGARGDIHGKRTFSDSVNIPRCISTTKNSTSYIWIQHSTKFL